MGDRFVFSIVIAFLLYTLSGNRIIAMLRRFQEKGQPIRVLGPKSHTKNKQNIPTMGGIFIIFSTIISSIIFVDLNNSYVKLLLFTLIVFAIIGGVDDYLKIAKYSAAGLSGKVKFYLQIILATIVALWITLLHPTSLKYAVIIPFIEGIFINDFFFFCIFAVFVITSFSNAVNLTDGLDGLASIPIIVMLICIAICCYIGGDELLSSQFTKIHHMIDIDEVIVLCGCLIGATLGFLWHNVYPAKVFMGDVGSISLGAILGAMTIVVKQEFIFVIIGGVFVSSAVSVILQVASFRLRGKRIFQMAPLHHHFEKIGWDETTIVVRFWILSLLYAIFGMYALLT